MGSGVGHALRKRLLGERAQRVQAGPQLTGTFVAGVLLTVGGLLTMLVCAIIVLIELFTG